MNKDNLLILLIILFLSVMSIFFTGAAFLFLIFGAVSYIVYRASPEEDRRFIMGVLIAGFLLRVFLAVMLHALNYMKGFHGISGDDLLYILKGWSVVNRWEGVFSSYDFIWPSSISYGVNPFTYLIAIFYKLFGFHPVMAKLINCLVAILISLVVYRLGRLLFDKKVAKISMLIVTFYPSMIRWSVANLKDLTMILLVILCLYLFTEAAVRKTAIWKMALGGLLLFLLKCFSQMFYFDLVVGIAGMATLFKLSSLIDGYGRRRKFLTAPLIFGLFAVGLTAILFIKHDFFINLVYECEAKQGYVARSDFAGYYLYTRDFIAHLVKGEIFVIGFCDVIFRNMAYFLLTPFPSQIVSLERLFALPQMFLWYGIIILSIFGFLKLWMHDHKTAFLIGTFLVVGISVNALAEGNIGAAFRHRDIFTPFFIILASSIISDLYAKKDIDR